MQIHMLPIDTVKYRLMSRKVNEKCFGSNATVLILAHWPFFKNVKQLHDAKIKTDEKGDSRFYKRTCINLLNIFYKNYAVKQCMVLLNLR